ncbi:MAG: sigma-70 family RNA polymerase sigma factor, partial [Opitutaceae bacterium]|nr:sigma-70 family RNA polymerase sigma factor [Opitutaceae bacterium]
MNEPPDTDTAEKAGGDPGDEALMETLQRGDERALDELMRRWETGVKAFLLRLGVPASDVGDVAQETFIRIFEKRASYRAGAAFKPWILTIAGNLGRNRLRWRRRRREESLDAADDERMADANRGEEENTGALVRAAVNELPDKLRSAVVCVELEELSYNEAAQVAGCTPKAIETRLYRARELLRQKL